MDIVKGVVGFRCVIVRKRKKINAFGCERYLGLNTLFISR